MLLKDRIKGGVFGLACGDYIGMPFEFKSSEAVNLYLDSNELRPETIQRADLNAVGYYTDDTSMMLCLAQSLIDKGFDVDDQLSKYRDWAFKGYMSADGRMAFGIGQNTLQKLLLEHTIPKEIKNNVREGGNGALMRCLPIGLVYYQDIHKIVNYSIKSALVTHNNTIAVWCCAFYNALIAKVLLNVRKEDLLPSLGKEYFYNEIPTEILNVINDIRNKTNKPTNNSGYSLFTLQIALYSFFNTNNYADAIEMAIRFGGDTDTQAAVTGGLAGAYWGFSNIPKNFINRLMNSSLIERISSELYINGV